MLTASAKAPMHVQLACTANNVFRTCSFLLQSVCSTGLVVVVVQKPQVMAQSTA